MIRANSLNLFGAENSIRRIRRDERISRNQRHCGVSDARPCHNSTERCANVPKKCGEYPGTLVPICSANFQWYRCGHKRKKDPPNLRGPGGEEF
jgi:hypothetical protein